MAEITVADDINKEHAAAMSSVAKALQHAVRCGELLVTQKQAMGATHGGKREQVIPRDNLTFTGWVKGECNFSYAQGARYMRLFRHKHLIDTEKSINGALAALPSAERTEKPLEIDSALTRLDDYVFRMIERWPEGCLMELVSKMKRLAMELERNVSNARTKT